MLKDFTMVFFSTLLLFSLSCGPAKQEGVTESVPTVIILDDQALKVLDPSAELEKLSCGYSWTEGPLWVEDGSYLLFSDIPTNTIYKYDSSGETTVYLNPSGYTGDTAVGHQPGSNGLILDHEDNLILLQQGDRRVARMLSNLNNPQPEFETLADSYQGNRLNSPNDAVMDSLGNIYFTDPTYGLAGGDDDPERELEFHGVYCLMIDGELRLLDQMDRPNGIALSPAQDRLYVSSSNYLEPKWYAYNVVEPGVIEEGSLFFKTDTIPGSTNAPDGMDVNKDGLIFTSGPGGVWLISSEGRALARINVPSLVSNCTLDTKEEYLYLTADDCLIRIKLNFQ